jgi:putative spermidine/putrescine transport system ATP-binding protein
MRQELRRMQRDLGITFVHVTHTQLEAIALADIVVVMEKGKIKQAGPAREVYAHPRDRYVAEFLGGQNVLSGNVEKVGDDHLVISQPNRGGIQVGVKPNARIAVGDRIDLAVRRDDIELMRADASGLENGATALPSRVLAIEYQGSFVKVMLDTIPDEDFVAYIPERIFFRDPFDIGDILLATWSAGRARVLA